MSMYESQNLHEGHRERMIDKVLKSPEVLSEHELLEVLLFSVIKRKDTNLLAHKILHTFGSLDKVFNATAKELTSVDGVGKAVATELLVLGEIYKRLSVNNKPRSKKERFSLIDNKDEILNFFKGLKTECFLVILLNERFVKITDISFTLHVKDTVSVDIPELVHALAINKPTYVIMAHNHPSGNVNPSRDDDYTTAKINMLCTVHGANLIDHVIVYENDYYSYRVNDKMDYIKHEFSFEKFVQTIKE